MNILGIETSTATCSVGFVDEEGVSVERSLVESHIHSEKLQTLISNVLQDAKTSMIAVDAVAVSIGPGSFTGLRIGLSSAKGLCYAIGKPILSVSTFEAMARAVVRFRPLVQNIVILLDAKQSDFYVGSFSRVGDLVETGLEVAVKPLEECVRALPVDERALVLTDSPLRIRTAFGQNVACESPHAFCRGDIVAHIGLEKFLSKQFSGLEALEPMYLKDFFAKREPLSAHA
ncbi:MAG: tRNA (adenosine(37)-N6)-threonylcarbamoyltransferase complex dimerization subunit type 1 TsaB [Ignavibacteriales bacterium]|nr:tRNA (adenosine(37)-N6)-threonylcarbamoyltransferase complex dimerization subunit type 1 TsaB [Ignavibacteriales bacterium]